MKYNSHESESGQHSRGMGGGGGKRNATKSKHSKYTPAKVFLQEIQSMVLSGCLKLWLGTNPGNNVSLSHEHPWCSLRKQLSTVRY